MCKPLIFCIRYLPLTCRHSCSGVSDYIYIYNPSVREVHDFDLDGWVTHATKWDNQQKGSNEYKLTWSERAYKYGSNEKM